ncbi:ribonuclease H-like domain-containing protein [Xylaria sp. CBS 124048]|nr:ribonuclease H-like domain-containing protein [Xylaria sp. CBS 124048]
MMAQELSSNWKKLQAQIKAESSLTPASSSKGRPPPDSSSKKRKATNSAGKAPASKKTNLRDTSSQAPRRQHPIKAATKQPRPYQKLDPKMGVTQSSVIVKGTSATVTPSLALWAQENDITAEDLAEAYNLGSRAGQASASIAVSHSEIAEDRHRINEGRAPGIEVGKYIAVDCEMVGIGPAGQDHALARVSCVDFHGKQVYDSFVIPRAPITDYRTRITGITASMLRAPSARPFDEVQTAVADLLKGRILIGHDVRHDLAVLELSHPRSQIRDTSRHSSFRQYGHGPKPALRILAKEVLGLDGLHKEKHSSVEDARVTMLLFRARKPEFDVQHADRYETSSAVDNKPKPNGPKAHGKKKKKKK